MILQANKVLRRQIDQLRKSREATLKDSALTRKQASSLEADVTERLNRLKKEQDTWRLDAAELQRLRTETPQLRDLLSQAEAKGLEKAHELQLAQRDLEQLHGAREKLDHAQKRLETLEYRQWEFDIAVRQKQMWDKEKMGLEGRLRQFDGGVDTRAPFVDRPRKAAASTSPDDFVWHPIAGLTWNPAAASRKAAGG